MTFSKPVSLAFVAALLAACASAPQQSTTTAPASTPASTATSSTRPVSAAEEAKTEADAASHLEKKFQEVARSYKVVQKDGKTMYCKREKVIGSTIPTMQCLTEAQLRLQVEQMDELRDRMRNNGGRCTMGAGCGAGG